MKVIELRRDIFSAHERSNNFCRSDTTCMQWCQLFWQWHLLYQNLLAPSDTTGETCDVEKLAERAAFWNSRESSLHTLLTNKMHHERGDCASVQEGVGLSKGGVLRGVGHMLSLAPNHVEHENLQCYEIVQKRCECEEREKQLFHIVNSFMVYTWAEPSPRYTRRLWCSWFSTFQSRTHTSVHDPATSFSHGFQPCLPTCHSDRERYASCHSNFSSQWTADGHCHTGLGWRCNW